VFYEKCNALHEEWLRKKSMGCMANFHMNFLAKTLNGSVQGLGAQKTMESMESISPMADGIYGPHGPGTRDIRCWRQISATTLPATN
jgi:hypothetical protein